MILFILLAFLQRIDRNELRSAVWMGVGAGAALSLVFGYILQHVSTLMMLAHEDIYEGLVMISAALLMLWMIIWMARSTREWKARMERASQAPDARDRSIGIFMLSFVAIFREGVEIVLFLQANMVIGTSSVHTATGVVLGMVGAVLLSLILLRTTRRVPLRIFFLATGIVILLLGTHIVAEGAESFGIFFGFPLEKMVWLSAGSGLLYALVGSTLWWWEHRKMSYSAMATSTGLSGVSPTRV